MITNLLKKVVGEEAIVNKERLEETDDLAIVVAGMTEFGLREFASVFIGDTRAWSEPLDSLVEWYNKR